MQLVYITVALAHLLTVSGASLQVVNSRAAFTLKNGQDAIALNAKFDTLNQNSPCSVGENACVKKQFAQCVGGKFVVTGCAAGTICAALPLVNKAGTSIACTTESDVRDRIAATGATAPAQGNKPPVQNEKENKGDNKKGKPDAQSSLTLDPAVLCTGCANDGQDQPTAGQVPSLTSKNNFINYCKTTGLPITNGKQVVDGSCNPIPMGMIPSNKKMPSSKFVSPKNLDKIKANKAFTVSMAIKNLETGHFVNPQANYYGGPQQLNRGGVIQGHSHIVIEKLESLKQTAPLDPLRFTFFKGLNSKADRGVLSTEVDKGLPRGFYKMTSINTASNHQPVLSPVAQHGSTDDAIYFTVE